MSARRTYLDYNATAPLLPEVRGAMLAALDVLGNPSSVHEEGRRARRVIDGAREEVAALIGASPGGVVFTSGATEANATALAGGWDEILASRIEHDSVLASAAASGARVTEISAEQDGVVRAESIERIAERVLKGPTQPARTLVALQLANNETGVLQPVAEVARFTRAHGLAMHCDAVQAAGRMEIDFRALGVDMISLSAHKLGGPKGVGALVLRDGLHIAPLIRGGGQERRRRAGTENVAAIAGFGAAAGEARRNIARFARIAELRDRLEREVEALTPEAVVIGEGAPRVANTSSIALPGRSAETLVIRLDLAGIAVSAGAACSSGKVAASHVLTGMGLAPEIVAGAIRISLGPQSTEEDVDVFLQAWREVARAPGRAAA